MISAYTSDKFNSLLCDLALREDNIMNNNESFPTPLPVKDLMVHLVDSLMLDCNDGVYTDSWNFIHELMWALKDRETLSELAKQLILDGTDTDENGWKGVSKKAYRLLRKLIAETNCEDVIYIKDDNNEDSCPYMEGIRKDEDPNHYFEVKRMVFHNGKYSERK